MIKALLFALLLAVAASAQNQPATAAQSTPTRNAKSADITVQGCVSGGERYTLMQVSTGAMFAMTGDTTRFAPYKGKFAEVRASELAPNQHSASGELPQLQVKETKVVADKCPEQPKANTGAASGGPAYGGPQAQQPAPSVSTPNYQSPEAPPTQAPSTQVTNPNTAGAHGAPSPGTGNTSQQPPPHKH